MLGDKKTNIELPLQLTTVSRDLKFSSTTTTDQGSPSWTRGGLAASARASLDFCKQMLTTSEPQRSKYLEALANLKNPKSTDVRSVLQSHFGTMVQPQP
jgi:hypothetical protein